MDSSGQISTESNLPPIDPRYSYKTFASIDISTPANDAGKQRLRKDSVFLAYPDGQEHPLIEDNLADAEAKSKPVLSERCCVVTDEAEHANFDSHDGFVVDEIAPFESNGLLEVPASPEGRFSSELSSEGRSGSSKRADLCPKFVLSESEPHGVVKSKFDGLGVELMGLSELQDDRTSKNAFYGEEKASELFPWKELPVDKSDIPRIVPKPPASDVTDLGDRGFYANLNATGRKQAVPSVRHDSQKHLALQERFYEALVRPHEEKKGYFPRALLSTLVTEECVFEELTNSLRDTHHASQIREYAKKICEESPLPGDSEDHRPPKIKSFKKIFVILVLIEETSSISKFLGEDVNDLNLPLVKSLKEGNGSRFDLRLSRNRDQSLECFQGWKQTRVTLFEEWQWTTVAPFFHKGSYKDVQHFLLQNSVILPFKSDGRRDKESNSRTEIEGGYSCVFQVDLHSDHHNFNLPKHQNQYFAVKRLNSHSKAAFKMEVEMLKMFSGDSHPHLISLLATYEQFRAYYLIFPWADSDLSRFWSDVKPKPLFDMDTILWVAKQCKGIAHGLISIHKYQTSNSNNHANGHEKRYGRHGDLKPENILWFCDDKGGTLKISDFGLSEYNTITNKSYITKSRLAWSVSYRPPECDLKNGRVGPSYDIWTLGCLYLEFITWLLGGWELVSEFTECRMSLDLMWWNIKTDTFFELVEVPNSTRPGTIVAMVKPAVTEFIRRLHAHERCSRFLHDFIDMIELDMMIVKPVDPHENRRISSAQVYLELKEMLNMCEDPDYVCKAAQPGSEGYRRCRN